MSSATLQHQVKITAQDGPLAGVATQVFDVDSAQAAELKAFELTFGFTDEAREAAGVVIGVKVTRHDADGDTSTFIPTTNEQLYIDEELNEMTDLEAFEEFVGPVSQFLAAAV